jgi:hypothetical protein
MIPIHSNTFIEGSSTSLNKIHYKNNQGGYNQKQEQSDGSHKSSKKQQFIFMKKGYHAGLKNLQRTGY